MDFIDLANRIVPVMAKVLLFLIYLYDPSWVALDPRKSEEDTNLGKVLGEKSGLTKEPEDHVFNGLPMSSQQSR